MSRPTLCLCTILKNESKTVKEMINSCVEYIDYAIICDTGSTDETCNIVRSSLTSHDIPYEIHNYPWNDNFAESRNKYLLHALGKTSHILVLDGDERLVVNNKNWKNNIDDICLVKVVENSGIEIRYPNIFKNNSVTKYIGKIHEQPIFPSHFHEQIINDIYIYHDQDISKRNLKFTRDLNICLEDEKIFETNPGRREYYIGISALNLSRFDLALEWFLKRNSIQDGSDEELWHSKFMTGICYMFLNNNIKFQEYMINAYNSRPNRIEPLDLLVKHYKDNNNVDKVNKYKVILDQKHSYPINDRICINRNLYFS